MAGSLIGALRVSLGLDSAQFDTGVKKAQQNAKHGSAGITDSFKSVVASAKLVTAAVVAIGSAAVVLAVRKSVDAMDDLSKAAQKVGTSVPELAKLRWAAELSGIAADSLETGLNKLNRAIVGIAPGATGAAGALQRMGVTAGTGTLDAMLKVADQFARMPDGATKSAMAIQLFGKAGADMIPLLNGGAAGIKAAADEAERLGLVLDTKTARAAEAFNDNLSRLGVVSDGITMQISAGLVPALAAITTELARSANVGGQWVDMGKGIGNAMLFIAESGFIAYEAIAGVLNAATSMDNAFEAIYSGKGFAAAGKIIGDQERATAAGIKARQASFARMRADIENFQPGELKPVVMPSDIQFGDPKKPKKEKDPFVAPTEREGWALQALLDRGTAADVEVNRQALAGVADTLADLQSRDFTLEIIRPEAFQQAERFAENLSASLGQALVFGQSIGQALVNSFKAAAAEMVTSGLMDMLLGGRDGGGRRSGGLLGSIFGLVSAATPATAGSAIVPKTAIPGFANGTNYAPGGLAMVGERGRELVNLPRGTQVIPNGQTEAMMAGRSSHVTVGIDPRNGNITAFVTEQITATAPAIAQAGAAMAQGQLAQRAQRRVR